MKNLILIMCVVLMIGVCNVQAAIDWDFYDDGTIGPGDEYNNVGVFDTPPDHTTVDMLGGIVDSMWAYDESTVNISGGYVGNMDTYNESTLNMSAGELVHVVSHDNSKLNITGGEVNVDAWGYSVVDISGGTFNRADPSWYSTVNFSGNASAIQITAEGWGILNMTGGATEYIFALESSSVNLQGGSVSGYITAEHTAIVNVFGRNLSATGIGGEYGYGEITGMWLDWTPFTISLGYNEDTYEHIQLHEIPEPGSLCLFGLAFLLSRKRK